MGYPRKIELIVPNDGHKLEEMVEEYATALDDGSIDRIELKVPLKCATRAISLSEMLRRRFADMIVENELTNIFDGKPGVDRRKKTMLVIRMKRSRDGN